MTSYTRHREDFTGPEEEDVIFHWVQGNSTPDYVDGTYVTTEGSRIMDDVVTPGFRDIIASGGIVNNSCWLGVEDWSTDGPGYVRATGIGNNAIWEQTGPITLHYSSGRSVLLTNNNPSYAGADVARAKLEALAHIDPTPYAFGEDTAELRETFRFLKRPMGEMYDAARKFYFAHGRKTLRQVAKLRTKAAASAVLEFQYAAAPLARSCMDAIEAWALRDTRYAFPARRSARGFESFEDETSGSFSYGNTTFEKTSQYNQELKASILYEVTNPVDDMEWRLGLRSKDFPVTMWQIIPLSFLVDRVYDVSSFLKAAINLGDPKVKIKAACVRSKATHLRTWKAVSRTSPYYSFSFTPDTVSYKIFTYDRDVWNPVFRDTIPEVKPKGLVDEGTKILELASLLISRYL